MKLAVIRIKGQVGINRDIVETFKRLRLEKKYSCVILENPSKEYLGMIKKLDNFTAYGEISEETLKKLKEKRATKHENFFRLHPPRKGIESKKHFGVGKGVLGNHGEKINELIERML